MCDGEMESRVLERYEEDDVGEKAINASSSVMIWV